MASLSFHIKLQGGIDLDKTESPASASDGYLTVLLS